MSEWVGNEEMAEEIRTLVREKNHLREDLKSTTAAFYGAKNELDRLREGLNELAEQMRSDITDMRCNNLAPDPGKEVAASMCEDFVERIRELLEGE